MTNKEKVNDSERDKLQVGSHCFQISSYNIDFFFFSHVSFYFHLCHVFSLVHVLVLYAL